MVAMDTKVFNDTVTISTVPDGVEIRADGKGGSGIFATRDFKVGEVVCTCPVILMPPDTSEVILQTQYGTHTLLPSVHSYTTSDGEAQEFYGFGSLTNHSCDPSTFSGYSYIYVDGKLMYQSIALRDIDVGEEVTEDYDMEKWDDSDPFDCMCGSNICRGRVRGFKFLDYDDQCKLLGQLSNLIEDVSGMWLESHPEVILKQLVLPQGVALTRCSNSIHGLKIVATQSFAKGVILYTVGCLNVDTKVANKIILSCPHPDAPETVKQTCIIDLSSKTSNENGDYQFCGIDEFKCTWSDPNTFLTRIDSTRYTVIAKRDINENEDITCCVGNN